MTTHPWSELHDATLESLQLQWSSGELAMHVRTGDTSRPWRIILGSAVRTFSCDRQMPWGFAVSINEVRGPTAASDRGFVLEIEMQSGDLIRVEAAAFLLQDAESSPPAGA